MDEKHREFRTQKEKGNAKALTLDNVMIKAIEELVEKREFTFEE